MAKNIDSTRLGFRDGLMELAAKRKDITLVSADSVKVIRADVFGEKYPERFFEMGISEQNAVAFASGLATCGLVPFVASYAGFLSMRACEQVRTFVAYPHLNVKLIGANGGMAGGGREGVTHQFFEDLGILSAIPGITLFAPADGGQVRKAVLAAADVSGPVYIRLGSGQEENFFPAEAAFDPFKARILVRHGSDVAILAYGFILHRVLEAAEILKKNGLGAVVLEVHTLKPIDEETVAAVLRETGAAVTVEDHNIHGGLGSAVACVAGERAPASLVRVGLRDRYPESGEADQLLDKYGLAVRDIVEAAETAVRKKR